MVVVSKQLAEKDTRVRRASDLDSEDERYHMLFNTMVQGVVYQDRDGKIISMNPAAVEILGKTPDEMLGRTSVDEEKDKIRDDGAPFPGVEHPSMVALRTGKAVSDVPMRVYNPKEKKHRWININAIPLFKPGSKKAYQVYTIFTDITDQRTHDSELRESERKFRSIVESGPYGMHFYELKDDRTLVFRGGNPSADRILGLDHSALAGRTIEEAFPGLVGTDIPDIYRRVAKTGVPWHSERVDYDADRITGAFDVFAFQSGPSAMVAAFQDISNRIRADQTTRALLRNIKEEKDRLTALINSIGDEVWFAGKDKKFQLANPKAVRQFGIDLEDHEIDIMEFASSLEVLRPDGSPRPPEDAPPLRALAGETVIEEEEIVRLPTTGELRYRQVTAAPVMDEAGSVIGSVSVVRDITERKKADDALRNTSEYLEKVFSYTNVPIIVWDTFFKITRFNRAFERMTGHSAGEVVGQDLSVLFPSESREESLELIARTLSGERWESVEIPILRSDGTIRIVLWNSANIYEKDGKTLTATIAQGQDITRRKDAEAALKESMRILERSNTDLETAKGRLETLIASMPVGVLITDTSGRSLAINESLKKMWGGNGPLPEDFDGFDKFKAWFAETGMSVASEDWPISKAIRKGASIPGQVLDFQRFDGTRGTMIASAVPIFDSSGRIVAGAAFSQDVSELKRVERAVSEEKKRLQFIVDSLPVAVGLYDSKGRRVLANSKVDTIWRGEMPASESPADFGKYLGYDSRTGVLLKPNEWPIPKVLETGEPVVNQEIDVLRLDKTPATILASAVPMTDDEGRTVGALIAYIDITAQKSIEKELARSNTELQSFAYAASHDLREPLRTISGFLEILSMDYGDRLDAEAKEHIRRAVNASIRLHVMIDDLLSYSRLETRKKPFRPVNLDDILAQALTDLNKTLTEHNATVTSDPLPTVWADDQQMAIVFRNLIDNGIKFHRTEAPKVQISARRKGDEWLIRFEDNGIGIDERYYGKVFDMFTRLHSRVAYPGTGIGLAMCKKIIERHGGHIWVESHVGSGSAFYFTIRDRHMKANQTDDFES